MTGLQHLRLAVIALPLAVLLIAHILLVTFTAGAAWLTDRAHRAAHCFVWWRWREPDQNKPTYAEFFARML